MYASTGCVVLAVYDENRLRKRSLPFMNLPLKTIFDVGAIHGEPG